MPYRSKPTRFRNIKARISFIAILQLFLFCPISQAAKFEPPEGKTILFIGQDKETIKEYVDAIGVIPAGFMLYTSLLDLRGITAPMDYGSGVQDVKYFELYPEAAVQIGLNLQFSLDQVLEGKLDENVTQLGQWFLNTQRPIFLRIGYEFDNPENSYDPEKYINAYRYLIDQWRAMGVMNVAYVWHSQAGKPDRPHLDWYPGDEYVDWIAVSYFSPYNEENMDALWQIAQEKHKPFMIAEATPVKLPVQNGEDTWKKWYSFVFKYIDKRNVKVFCYINSHWDAMPQFIQMQWGDARLQENKYILKRWKEIIQTDRFINYPKERTESLN